MDNINKVKEWILVNYTKRLIIKSYNNKNKQYIFNEILNNVDKKFNLNIDEMEKINFFIEKYIQIILSYYKPIKYEYNDKK